VAAHIERNTPDLRKNAARSESDSPNVLTTVFSMVNSPSSNCRHHHPNRFSCQAPRTYFRLPFAAPLHMARRNLFMEVVMPVVHIYMFPGRTKEQKNELVKRITKDFGDVANVKPESLNILFHDTGKEDWGVRGVLASEQ
jgi:4-oxalocrotonate tautomerase